MNSLLDFMKAYEEQKKFLPQMYLHISESRKGDYWRIKVFANDMAIIGDAELLNVEHENKDEALKIATNLIKDIPSKIAELMEIKRLGRKVYVKKV